VLGLRGFKVMGCLGAWECFGVFGGFGAFGDFGTFFGFMGCLWGGAFEGFGAFGGYWGIWGFVVSGGFGVMCLFLWHVFVCLLVRKTEDRKTVTAVIMQLVVSF